nr:phosphotransferase [Paenibacillus xylanexedens]
MEMNHELQNLLQRTIKEYIHPAVKILNIETTPIHSGTQAVHLMRHHVQFKVPDQILSISLVSKQAARIEQRVLTWLYSQKANVPFSLSSWSVSDHLEAEERSLLCIEDVDYQTDYTNLDIGLLQKREIKALSHIHISKLGQKKALSWLPEIDTCYVEKMIGEYWKPQWQAAKQDEQFIELFGDYIPIVESAADAILKDIQHVLNDQSSQTLIHNDLNPGNVLVRQNTEVIFIDWEEAKYGSLFLDIAMRCRTPEQMNDYRDLLSAKSIEFTDHHWNQLYTIASRYLGLRYMTWNLGAWTTQSNAKDQLRGYLDMVAGR